MTIKKQLLALAAATALALPSAAQADEGPSSGYVMQQGTMAVLVALLLPAVQKVREAARR